MAASLFIPPEDLLARLPKTTVMSARNCEPLALKAVKAEMTLYGLVHSFEIDIGRQSVDDFTEEVERMLEGRGTNWSMFKQLLKNPRHHVLHFFFDRLDEAVRTRLAVEL